MKNDNPGQNIVSMNIAFGEGDCSGVIAEVGLFAVEDIQPAQKARRKRIRTTAIRFMKRQIIEYSDLA